MLKISRFLRIWRDIILTILTLTIFSSISNAQLHIDKYDEKLTITDIKEIYATEFPTKLREVFNEYLKIKKDTEENIRKINLVENYIDLFSKKFIIH
jgi:hypothetical protein